jgi:hypothetical protein
LSFFLGCSSFGHQSPYYVKLAHEITAKTANKLKDQKNFYLAGTGGQMMDDIEMLMMGFYFYYEVDLETARTLVVYAIKEYLLEINNDQEIRPYLHEYPFTAKNIEIIIWIYNPDRSNLSSEKIYNISAINGLIDYYMRGSEKYSRQVICEETYEKALNFVNK